MPTYISRIDAAIYLKVSPRTLYRRSKEGKIPFFSDHAGSRILYAVEDLDAYMRSIRHPH